jgi:hypothetical protein
MYETSTRASPAIAGDLPGKSTQDEVQITSPRQSWKWQCALLTERIEAILNRRIKTAFLSGYAMPGILIKRTCKKPVTTAARGKSSRAAAIT